MTSLLVIPIGGLGRSQLDDIAAALRLVPGVLVAEMPKWDAYKEEPPYAWQWMDQRPTVPVLLIGHSLGGPTARNTANVAISKGRPVAGLVLIDNVQWFDDDHHCDATNVLVCRSERPGFVLSGIPGHLATVVPGTDHNSVCHDASVIAAVVQMVQKAAGAS